MPQKLPPRSIEVALLSSYTTCLADVGVEEWSSAYDLMRADNRMNLVPNSNELE